MTRKRQEKGQRNKAQPEALTDEQGERRNNAESSEEQDEEEETFLECTDAECGFQCVSGFCP